MSERRRIAIVDWHEKRSFYAPLTSAYAAEWIDVAPPTLANRPPAVDLVLVNDETWPYCAAGLAECTRRGIPSLHLLDGICEWRNTWENPRPAAFLQPVLATKIACLGRAQARLIECWGNAGKCVVTGSPRFDSLIGRRPRAPRGRTVMIATARTPAFHERDRRAVETALADLRDWFRGHPEVTPVWRLTGGLDAALGVVSLIGTPLAAQLAEVDAVICTPSNVILESMLHGLPVAMLDYTNSPAYVQAAWSVTATPHIGPAVEGLLAPEPHRMDWQRALLADQLECATPAAARVIALMEELMGGAPMAERPAVVTDRTRELEAEITHLREALRLRPSQVLYRAFCEVKRRLGGAR